MGFRVESVLGPRALSVSSISGNCVLKRSTVF